MELSKTRTRGRPDIRFCKRGIHAWTPESIYMHRGHAHCKECHRTYERIWRRAHYKHRRSKVGGESFNVDYFRIDKFLDYAFGKFMSIKEAARKAQISYGTARRIYWAERDRRAMAAA